MSPARHLLAADTMDHRVEFAHLPHGWWAFGGIVLLGTLLALVVFLYWYEQRAGASARLRLLMAALRCSVLLLLAFVWLQPVLATYIQRRIESHTLILIDNSASMSVRDRYPAAEDAARIHKVLRGPPDSAEMPTRAEIIRTALARDDGRVLQRLAAANPVKLYQFGERLTEIHPPGAASTQPTTGVADEAAAPPDAGEPVTDVGRAVRQAIESQGGAPIAAVVVLSDGRFNQGEPADVVGRYARAKRIPIHTVGVGDPSPPRNISVVGIDAPPNVFVKDPFKVTAHLRAQGLAGAPVIVELLQSRQGGTPGVVETRQAQIGADGSIPPVVFNRQIAEASEVNLIVRAQPDPAETLTGDNEKQVTVRALEGKMRVLLVAGAASWEYRYLTHLLERDATIDLSCWLQSADEASVRDGNTVIDHLPREQEELFQYACIILLDPQSRDIDPAWAAHVESLVGSYGGGLLYVAGRMNTPRFAHDPNTRPLLELLPVVIDPNESDLVINELGHFQSAGWPFAIPPEAAGSSVLALSDQPGESAQIWARLPGVFWHYPVRREKPVATVLLRHSNPSMRTSYGGHVLLATQYFGSGRTGYMAFDTTWRWRRYGDRYFNRFWIQLLRHMVEGRLLSGQDRGLIQVERDQYSVGEPVRVEARLLDTRHLPLTQEQVQARVTVEGRPGRTFALSAQPNRPGWYRGHFIAEETGTHALQIDLPGAEGVAPAVIRGEVRVGRADLEFRQPELDRAALETLAAQSAGGRYLEIDALDELPELIPSKTATLVLTGQPVSLWDRWWVFIVLIVLLGLEWALRKRARLL